MNAGSMFSGIGGLDLAVEWALGASTAWQFDLVGNAVCPQQGALAIRAGVEELTSSTGYQVELFGGEK